MPAHLKRLENYVMPLWKYIKATAIGFCLAWASPGSAQEIAFVKASPETLTIRLKGAAGPVELLEFAPNTPTNSTGLDKVVFKGNSQNIGGLPDLTEVRLPRFEVAGERRRDRLYSAFAVRLSGRTGVAGRKFVTELDNVSADRSPFPLAASKKGLQVQMVDDAVALGVKHAALNVNLTQMVDLTRGAGSLRWETDGETYFFHRSYVEHLPVKALSDAGALVYFILLTYESGNADLDRVMLHPRRAAQLPNKLAAFNTTTDEGLKHYKACLEFLADRFCKANGPQGRVAGFIVGNEITAHWHWYNMGEAPANEVVSDYLRAVRVANMALRKASASARVYLSFDHHWTLIYGNNPQRAIAGKALLDEFNRQAAVGGNFDWHVAYHPYPENLGKPHTWLDKTALPSTDTPRITFKNLEQLTAYLRRPEFLFNGEPRRVILSEQGFHAVNSPEGELAQAAAYCYAWKKVEAEKSVDAFILHRHVDHSMEGGLNLGLWRRKVDSVATPESKRRIYEVFQKADTTDWKKVFEFALPVIGITDWSQIQAR